METNTDVVDSLAGLRAELLRLRRGIVEVAAADQIGIAAVGTAPSSAFADFELTTTGRYGRMQEQYRLLVDEQLICGLQIHVGVSDRDLAVEIMQRIARDLPVLLALSASSPYWNEQDTGYASIRTIIWQRWPTAGATGPLPSAAGVRRADRRPDQHRGHRRREDGLLRRPALGPRPDPGAARLRRLPDRRRRGPDRRAVPGHACWPAEQEHRSAGEPFDPVPPPIHRAAIWRAARGGLAGELLDDSRHPKPMPAAEAVRALVARLRPQLEELGDWDEVRELAETALARGNSADRQRAAYAERGRLDDVVELVVARDPRTGRRARAGRAGAAPLPLPRRRRGGRARAPAPPGLPRPRRLLPRSSPADELQDRKHARDGVGGPRPG